MKVKNYYYIFGVQQDVGVDEIKKVYWKFVCKYYLDVFYDLDGENKFKEIGEVYEMLKMLVRCQVYDWWVFFSMGRWMENWLVISLFICWSGVLWFKLWFWWIDLEQIEENENVLIRV